MAVLAIGYDMVDVAACKARGVLVSNVPAASSKFSTEPLWGKLGEGLGLGLGM